MGMLSAIKKLFSSDKKSTQKNANYAEQPKDRQEAGWMLGSVQKKDKTLVQTWKEMCIAQGQNPTEVLLGIMRFQVNSGGVPDDLITAQKVAQKTEEARAKVGEVMTIAQLADQLKTMYVAQQMDNIQQIKSLIQALAPLQIPYIQPSTPPTQQTQQQIDMSKISKLVEQAFKSVPKQRKSRKQPKITTEQIQQMVDKEFKTTGSKGEGKGKIVAKQTKKSAEEEIKAELLGSKKK